MQLHPQLTPDEQRLIRNWSFGMAMLYGLFLLGIFALAIIFDAWRSAGENAAGSAPQGTAPHVNALRASD